ncbi:S53 family peptidase [Nocardia sp. CA2R105]|uniref:S53 family peptidase n=1 Tax=Nocardia coffeae TaxID=2873381 RepID=UPI001CA66E47|nr:S53 family peptidase [Nocardia coffeae]MBY8859105.1 S53 family peptidase [Nocardia coffeae]
MSDAATAALPGSARAALAGVETLGPVDPAATVEFTVVLRRRAELPADLITGPRAVSVQEFTQQYGADPADLELVVSTLESAGATILEQHPGSRRVRASAPVSVAQKVFATELVRVNAAHPVGGAQIEHRMRTGELSMPAALENVVTAVLGLDDRPQVGIHLRTMQGHPTESVVYTPPQLAEVYHFPQAGGSQQRAAILEFGGGYDEADIAAYFAELGIEQPEITSVGVDGAVNAGTTDDAALEVALDIDVIGSVAPGAEIVVYFAPNSDQGFVDAVAAAVHADVPYTVISISWGMAEERWTPQALGAIDALLADAAALGVTVFVSSGDDGSRTNDSTPGPHVSFPASSPHVLAVGGTTLYADLHTRTVDEESVWSGHTGGGVSTVFELPVWQKEVAVPPRAGRTGRGIPDVAADADAMTGYLIRVRGTEMPIGGTSAAAPLWAGLFCRIAELLLTPVGLLQPALYKGVTAGQAAPGFRDITEGTNGLYRAGAGWDACTGLGVPHGEELLEIVRQYLIYGAD